MTAPSPRDRTGVGTAPSSVRQSPRPRARPGTGAGDEEAGCCDCGCDVSVGQVVDRPQAAAARAVEAGERLSGQRPQQQLMRVAEHAARRSTRAPARRAAGGAGVRGSARPASGSTRRSGISGRGVGPVAHLRQHETGDPSDEQRATPTQKIASSGTSDRCPRPRNRASRPPPRSRRPECCRGCQTCRAPQEGAAGRSASLGRIRGRHIGRWDRAPGRWRARGRGPPSSAASILGGVPSAGRRTGFPSRASRHMTHGERRRRQGHDGGDQGDHYLPVGVRPGGTAAR